MNLFVLLATTFGLLAVTLSHPLLLAPDALDAPLTVARADDIAFVPLDARNGDAQLHFTIEHHGLDMAATVAIDGGGAFWGAFVLHSGRNDIVTLGLSPARHTIELRTGVTTGTQTVDLRLCPEDVTEAQMITSFGTDIRLHISPPVYAGQP
jgi:hypothetical protein